MTGHTYSDDFLKYVAQSSAYSAFAITSILSTQIKIESVLDVGCATGTWLRAWSQVGVKDLQGIDGEYVDRRMLEVPESMFTAVDLNDAFDIKRQFDLVQSLEVAEHIEELASESFAESLVRHAHRYILFSAAPPGQGGEYHINEQPYEFWRQKFERRGFVTIDAVRPAIADNKRISYWYRYNTLLFVKRDSLTEISEALQTKIVPATEKIDDISPLSFRLRKAIVGRLPTAVQNEIANLKSKFFPSGRI
jgi:SAM-dependent methyltransferase